MNKNQSETSTAQILLEVAQQFGSTLSLERLLPLVLDRVTSALKAERALFALLDSKGNVEQAVVHNLKWEGPGHPLPFSHGLIEKVIETEDLVFVADAQEDQDFGKRRSVRALEVRFMVGVPLHVEGRVGGVICVDSRSIAAGDAAEEVELLKALAQLVGTAVENARLFEEQQYKTFLLSQMAHDLRVPLAVISMNAQMLGGHAECMTDDTQPLIADVISGTCRMSRMLENTLELARVESETHEATPQAVDLTTELERHINVLRPVAHPGTIQLERLTSGELPRAWTVMDWVWIILDNLVFNAIKYSDEGSPILIRLGLRPDRGPLQVLERPFRESIDLFRRKPSIMPPVGCMFHEISIQNHGEPIDTELLSTMFEPFSFKHVSNPRSRSTGIGLSIVDQCARHLGGAVWASSDEERTTVIFTLPSVPVI